MNEQKHEYTGTVWNDPFSVTPDADVLALAHSVALYGTNARYWDQYPIPKSPLTASVKNERQRQVTVYLFPLLLLAAVVAQVFSMDLTVNEMVRWISVGVLLAVSWFWWLANMYETSVNNAIARARHIDGRRFDLCLNLLLDNNVHPATVTPKVVAKLLKDYKSYREKQDAKKRGWNFTGSQYSKLRKLAQGGANKESLAIAAGAMGLPAMATADTIWNHEQTGVKFNTNGLPMIEGTMVDVAGNTYGATTPFTSVDMSTGELFSSPMDTFSTGADMGSNNFD